ncbi:MAG: ATP-dependent DNA helicase RecG [Flavobacteriales bacterium]|nr:ATP-dependent DNA helicase RecG [Flavobacteriales bacterium]MBK9194956.1 ATP-dependent DNA helicase RecG [Flavobacteriales bacterium]
MHGFLETPIEYLKGVGPQRGELLRKELNIGTFGDLLLHYPFRYVDRSRFHLVREINEELPNVQLRGTLSGIKTLGEKQAKRLVAKLTDASGSIELVWFKGIRWLQPVLKEGGEYIVFGKPTLFREKFNIAHPEIEAAEQWQQAGQAQLQPVYSTTEKAGAKGVNSRGIWKLQQALLPQLAGQVPETLTDELIAVLGGMSKEEALRQAHQPLDQSRLDSAIRRLKFEELFFIQLQLLMQKVLMQRDVRGNVFGQVGDLFNTFYKQHLPFQLTNAQKRVVKEIRHDMGSGKQMNRLLQGDVGSGKTLVALLSMLIALDNGFQAAILAPTEILAQQHFNTLVGFLRDMPLQVRLLTGSTKAPERKGLLTALERGDVHILVGTHALLEDRVRFKNLGFTVIDEQHRFGVAQRARMQAKATVPPHVLVMTATPIPRTLAMTLYGDLDVSVIDELPPGRKPIKTVHRTDAARNAVFHFMEQEVEKGRQIYVVYPLIEESTKKDPAAEPQFQLKDLMDGFESMVRRFPPPKYAVSIVHGRMDPEVKDYEMARFKKGETDIMVSTTVIEVGVDVPNASVMVIENAERFGLAQLHQLRGRVGRGAELSYCILMTGERLGNDGRTRISTMVRTQDGFEISEVDLRLRGPGDIMGTQQSGIPQLHLADLIADAELLQQARRYAQRLLDADPALREPENARTAGVLREQMKDKAAWGRIG